MIPEVAGFMEVEIPHFTNYDMVPEVAGFMDVEIPHFVRNDNVVIINGRGKDGDLNKIVSES